MATSESAVLVLASGSPRRRELLSQLGIPLLVCPSEAEEPPFTEGDAVGYARSNARLKALERAGCHPRRFILGADTVVILDGQALGKPRDVTHGVDMLTALSGREHHVTTAYCIVTPDGEPHTESVTTRVRFKALSSVEIKGYLATGEPMDKAGAYAIQGIGTFAVASIDGSYSNVVGLPVVEVLATLKALGGPVAFGG